MKAIAIMSSEHGKIQFQQKRTSLKIQFQLVGFEPNKIYAIHIHEYGDISNGCVSLGSHFNPTNRQHGEHAGDLFNNFMTNKKGEFKYTWETDKLSLNGNELDCILGRSVVIHEFQDDLGLKGKYIKNIFKYYREMTYSELFSIYSELGYHKSDKSPTQNVMLEKLETESITTGNASTRISYGIIGISK